jgi:CHAD domain-containing protein
MARYAAIDRPVRKYALEQTEARLRRFAYQMGRTGTRAEADAIHDLRVSIRRLSQCLRAFGAFLPRGKVKKVRRGLRSLMNLAAEVRNSDVALGLLSRAGVAAKSPVAGSLRRRRLEAEQALLGWIKQWQRRDLSRKWRAQLEL